MPLIDTVKIYGEAVAEVLDTDERLLAMGPVHVRRPGVFESALIAGVDWTGLRYGRDRLRSGPPATGSWGRRTQRVLQAREVTSLDWAVTDRRLLLLDNDRVSPPHFRPLMAVPRAAIRSVRRRGRLFLQWGRVEVTFTDGSMVALVLAMVDVSAAAHFLRALTSG
ncbi:hypothetical protein ODJ79_03515 [Actinoplanes sp. KI2]|uniref:hypothetical protein n=1 Tax=Actinoplanes sp. KI2 TaxID=2983315 RepID=UPI0021D5B4B9|nr:hypothetical protein [Actinoplanes sp. KI2]MCU7722774.1 hypothetical protein [Actinoplanes sp. KI2]